MRFLPFVIALGVLLSGYAYYVEIKTEEAKRMGSKYKALCDIGIFSCTKVFSSEFGSLSQFLGLPKVSNAIVGILFYLWLLLIEPYTKILLLFATLGALSSIALFYVLTVTLHDFCIVCFSIYVVNFSTFFTAIARYRRLRKLEQQKVE